VCDRIKAAVDGRTDRSFVIMARTDAIANEDLIGTGKKCEIGGGSERVSRAVTDLDGTRRSLPR
jgi:hypothetical protein